MKWPYLGPGVLLPLSLLLVRPTAPAAAPAADDAKAPLILPADVAQALRGHWVVNRELSDDPREKIREAMRGGGRGGPGGMMPGGMGPGGMGPGGMGGRGGGMGGRGGSGGPGGERGGPGGPGAMVLAGTLAAHALDLELNEVELLITQHVRGRDGSEDKQSRVVDLTGRKVGDGSAESQAKWKGDKLVIETKGERGSAKETWLLVKEPRRLEIKTHLQMQGPTGGSGVDLKRVFDAAPEGGEAPQTEPPARPRPTPEPRR